MRKKTPAIQNNSGIEIPSGAAIYATVTAAANGIVSVHGDGGHLTSVVARKGPIEVRLPPATIMGISPGNWFVAWNGRDYVFKPTMQSIQETDHLTFIGSVTVPPSDLAEKFAAAGIDISSTSPLLWMAMRAGSEPDTSSAVMAEPPLHPSTRDAIKQAMFRVDQIHWQHITKMRVRKHYPLDEPVPPQLPEVLMGEIRWYASMLFGTGADQYDSFRTDVRYSSWLASLADRVRVHVMTNLDRLENGDPEATIIAYHGLTTPRIEEELRTILSEIRGQYETGTAPSQRRPGVSPISPVELAETSSPAPSRKQLRDSYLSTHARVKKLDICWAAGQHYTEWKRWLRGVLKDGSTPDQAFRTLLGSDKSPQEYKAQPRPRGWK